MNITGKTRIKFSIVKKNFTLSVILILLSSLSINGLGSKPLIYLIFKILVKIKLHKTVNKRAKINIIS